MCHCGSTEQLLLAAQSTNEEHCYSLSVNYQEMACHLAIHSKGSLLMFKSRGEWKWHRQSFTCSQPEIILTDSRLWRLPEAQRVFSGRQRDYFQVRHIQRIQRDTHIPHELHSWDTLHLPWKKNSPSTPHPLPCHYLVFTLHWLNKNLKQLNHY